MTTGTTQAAPSGTVGAVVRCDRCGHDWPAGCEQAVAIRKRGKCIVCLIALGEHFSMAPYEFPSDPGYTPNKVLCVSARNLTSATRRQASGNAEDKQR